MRRLRRKIAEEQRKGKKETGRGRLGEKKRVGRVKSGMTEGEKEVRERRGRDVGRRRCRA